MQPVVILRHGIGHLAITQGKHHQGCVAGGEYFIQLHLAHQIVARLPCLPCIGAIDGAHGHILRTHAHNAVLVHPLIIHAQHRCTTAHRIIRQAVFKTRGHQVQRKAGQPQHHAQQGIAPGGAQGHMPCGGPNRHRGQRLSLYLRMRLICPGYIRRVARKFVFFTLLRHDDSCAALAPLPF
ncbi:hypothetical protein SDC9_123854 [bioreactor metagenome]|uniref:Uncharacterized protein n=1 Tax=bioreactor metagenome TaxID=1076179 RepID=A0A645CIS9_9ZZZZ